MATTPTKPAIEVGDSAADVNVPAWPTDRGLSASREGDFYPGTSRARGLRPSGGDALQALLAFSALHQQVRQRPSLASRIKGFETIAPVAEFEAAEQFVLDEVLQLVAERAISITGADGLGIALAENNEIVLRASAGAIKPDVGQRIQRDSAFSGACFRTAQIIRCDDTETDDRVNLYACRQLGARSMVAVPLCGRRRVIGLLEAFSSEPFGFNDSDVSSLGLLAELILGALKPEDEERFAESAQVAEAELAAPAIAAQPALAVETPSPEGILRETAVSAIAPAVETSTLFFPPATELRTEPELAVEDAIISETASSPEHSAAHHPGIVLVLVLVVICAMLAGGLWWKLKTAQLSKVMMQPEQKITKPIPAAKQPQPSPTTFSNTASSIAPSSITPSSVTPSSSSATLDVQANSSGSENVTPLERSKMPRITGIRHWSSADSSTVVLDLEDQVQYEAHRLASPDRIYFDLHDTSLA